MENTNTSLLNLQEKLKEIFEINNSDLDFGIYRIMKFREKEIKNFIDIELPKTIDSKFKSLESSSKNIFDKVKEFEENSENETLVELYNSWNNQEIENASKYNPKFKEYVNNKNSLKDSKKTSIESDDIYNWLNAFFTSYYDKWDFFKTRKQKWTYKFEWWDVGFTWATEGQYYIKSWKHFNNYTFLLNDDKKTKITFELLETKEAINNNKDKCKLIFGWTKDVIDEETWEIIESFTNIQIKDNEIVLFFEYKEWENKNNTDNILEVISKSPFAILTKFLTDKKTEKTKVLDYHLTRFETESKRDFFIHKNLKWFLNTELEEFINRVIWEKQTAILWNVNLATEILKKLQVMREVSITIIDFIAGVEEYQKAIFEKKKFVVESEYCMTLDKVSKDFYDEILKNKEQVEEWKNLWFIDDKTKLDKAYLEQNQTLVLDTKFFPTLKSKILASFENLDEETNWLLINSENFQALNLMLEKYRWKVKCIYIDPPYNTGTDWFWYKDSFKHSSWLSMMEDRLNLWKDLLKDDWVIFVSIDDFEVDELFMIMNKVFWENLCDKMIWRKSWEWRDWKMKNTTTFRNDHEYILVWYKKEQTLNKIKEKPNFQNEYPNPDNDPRWPYKAWSISRTEEASNPNSDKYYTVTSPKWVSFTRQFDISKEDFDRLNNDIQINKFWEKVSRIYWWKEWTAVPAHKIFTEEERMITPYSLLLYKWTTTDWTKQLADLIWNEELAKKLRPKPPLLVRTVSQLWLNKNEIFIDFFSWSWTSQQAIIELNSMYSLNCKYIWVEMWEYFEWITKKRVQKVIYSNDWINWKPSNNNWVSQIFKYQKLEQYEDSLNNLQEPQKLENQAFLNTELNKIVYELNNNETSSISILNDDSFIKNPFSQTMKIGEEDFKKVNFVDTFNYLLWINVEKYLITEDNTQVVITWNKELSNWKIQKFFIVWFDNKNDVDSRFEKIVNSYKNLIEKADFIYCNHQVSNSEYTTKDIYPEFYELTFKSSK